VRVDDGVTHLGGEALEEGLARLVAGRLLGLVCGGSLGVS